jgi:hypothetical protein
LLGRQSSLFGSGGAVQPLVAADIKFKIISHRRRLPLAAARRGDAATAESGGDLAKRLRAGGLSLANRRHDGSGVRIGLGLLDRVGGGADFGQAGIAQPDPPRLGGAQSGLSAFGDQPALLLGDRGAGTSGPNSAARNGTPRDISPEMYITRKANEFGEICSRSCHG